MYLMTTTILCLVFGADVPLIEGGTKPRLVIVPNASEILQRDHLLLLVLVENRGKTDINILHGRRTPIGEYVRLEVHDTDRWRSVRTMKDLDTNWDGGGYGSANKERGRAILAGSTYAELPALLRDRDSFLFDKPGKVELRAFVLTREGKLVSDPITITVGPRSALDLRRIEEALKVLNYLELRMLDWKLPEKLTALADVGGNMGRTLDNIRVLQEFAGAGTVDGVPVPREEICNALKRRFDPVNWNMALDRLGPYFRNMGEWRAARTVVASVPYDSGGRREMLLLLRLLVDPTAAEGKTRRDFGADSDERIESD